LYIGTFQEQLTIQQLWCGELPGNLYIVAQVDGQEIARREALVDNIGSGITQCVGSMAIADATRASIAGSIHQDD